MHSLADLTSLLIGGLAVSERRNKVPLTTVHDTIMGPFLRTAWRIICGFHEKD